MKQSLLWPVMALSLLASACQVAQSPAPLAQPHQAQPLGANWPDYGGGENAAHHSQLNQITTQNINQLGLDWYYDIDTTPNAFSAPIAVDGIVYFAAGYSVIHAIDGVTGKLLWQYDPQAAAQAGQGLRSSWGIRGIAYAQGKIFTGTVDGRLIALDAKTGALVWSAQTLTQNGTYVTGAPWIAGNKVVIGFGGADFMPVRGYVTAYDINSGKQAWRFYTVPGDPSKGFENKAMEMAAKTWTGEWWKFGGGGTAWNAMAYDPKQNLIFIGTGNGAPWNQKIRSPGGGDNLFLCSIVALNADTGAYVWHYQVNPGETWDYNAAMDITLADMKINGKLRHVILHAPKNGFFYVIDRTNGKLISAEKFAPLNWATHIDLKTGRPVEIPEARYPDRKPVLVYPGPTGAHNVEAMSYNPQSGLVFFPVYDQSRVYVDWPGKLSEWKYEPGQLLTNNGTGPAPANIALRTPTAKLIAWDPRTQKLVWSNDQTPPRNGGTMSTAGGLVFQGDINGIFSAYDGQTGKSLWRFDAHNGLMAQPISYWAHGKQYVTIIASWRGPTGTGRHPEWEYQQQKRRVLTFAIGGTAKLPDNEHIIPMPYVDDAAFKVDEALAAKGASLFAPRCAICHGAATVSGGAAPDLRKSQIPLSADAFNAVLHDGALQARGMPTYADLSSEEREALRHYIRQQARKAMANDAKAVAAAAEKMRNDQ